MTKILEPILVKMACGGTWLRK